MVHSAPSRFGDRARFSLAHGGKDRHPFPVLIAVYVDSIQVLKTAVAKPGSAATTSLPHCRVSTTRLAGSKAT
jgi:hypothetical protein